MPFILNNFGTRQTWNVLEDQEIFIGLIMMIFRTKGWDFNTVFYSYRCEYYINTSCGMTQIKDTSISFISEQCHVCYHYPPLLLPHTEISVGWLQF